MTKIKETRDTTKVIKSQRQPKNLKKHSPLLHSEKTQHKVLPNARKKRCKICDIIIEGISYTFKN